MRALPDLNVWGENLTPEDYANLEKRWIPKELADTAGIRRVSSLVGREMFGRKRGDLAGLIIPNLAPWSSAVREYRLRVDMPPLEQRSDGRLKECQKYIQPTGRPNLLYFPPGLAAEHLTDERLPLIIVEGEFKSLACFRLANYLTTALRFLPLSIAGVNSFVGTIGKVIGPKGDRRDLKGILPDFERLTWKDRPVIIAFDADVDSNPRVRAARSRLSVALIERGATIGLLEWRIEEGKGIDDWLFIAGPEKVLAAIGNVTFGGWRTRLLRNDSGRLITCYENAAMFLENAPEWVGVLGHNTFTGGYTILKPAPAPITAEVGKEIEDQFDTEVVRWLERRGLMVRPEMVRRVIDLLARRHPYHPVVDYLESLPPWDEIPRIGTWLSDYCGVESSDEEPNTFSMAAGRKFLISAVARVMEPGCKVDHILTLEAEQGEGKSTAARVLAGDEYFSDQLAEMGTKDASMQVRGVWIIELSELDALNRSEVARAKAFISQQIERFRLPYGHRLMTFGRQCVFIGTTNSETWLKDGTGNRRFWPVRCGSLDVPALIRDRDLLWAEALAAYNSGEAWWFEDKSLIAEAAEEQRGRLIEDPWQDRVIGAAETLASLPPSRPCGRASIAGILAAIGIDLPKQDQSASNRVARCLKVGGWERFRYRDDADDDLHWSYRKKREKPRS